MADALGRSFKYLSRIKDVTWIEAGLNGLHDFNRRRSALFDQVFALADANTVFTGASAADGKRAFDHPCIDDGSPFAILRTMWLENEEYMIVAVTDMADDCCGEIVFLDIGAGFQDAFGEAGNRHTYVGRPDRSIRAQRLCREIGVVPGCPELVSVFHLGGDCEFASSVGLCNVRELARGRCQRDGGWGASLLARLHEQG